ncbi:uncharacterized protein LOC116266010 isoform X2 [Nymphaea colorata]|uniref:uncharacterized protein LOC116266010 isoform X2 n=1 Tax=Nymphaea colorata TaxID=210225 RepID=UPI00129DAC12|nr:uncharacterized protein LOC116266010 isoform X2 [Nymphaea colorata]
MKRWGRATSRSPRNQPRGARTPSLPEGWTSFPASPMSSIPRRRRLKKAAPEGGSAMAKPREDRQKRSLRASAMKPAKPAQKAAGSVLKADTNNGGGRHGEGSEGKEKTGAGLRQRLAARFGLRQVDCWPLALVVLLVCLLVFGRLAAVVCTTIWLYFLASFFAADSKQHATNGRKRNMGCSTC